jgi:Rrf2 family protein
MKKLYKGIGLVKLNIILKIIFAVKSLVKIAANKNNEPVAVNRIADEYNISYYYLEQIFLRLKRAKIVKPIMGYGGGFVLLDPPGKISLFRIFKAFNTSTDILKSKYYYRPLLLKENLHKKVDIIVFKTLIERFAEKTEDVLKSVTIADIIKETQKYTK